MTPQPTLGGLDLLRELVGGFRANLPRLREQGVTEASIRQEYIDPFWIALGWDVGNTRQLPPDEKEVVIEANVSDVPPGRNRRPDYLFRIAGLERFLVEAKKPAVDIRTDKESVFQAKTYAWNQRLPFVVLSDFEEFRLYDCTIKPHYDDPDRGVVRDFCLRFEDYVSQWDVLAGTFSRDAVAGGSLDRLWASIKKVRAGRRIRGMDRMLVELRGSEPIDRDFLAFLEDYRVRFAQDLLTGNRAAFADADTRHGAARLTEAAQRLIDRLVFIRVCEDRDIAQWGALRDTVNRCAAERADLYPALCAEFRALDREYNGYLFKAHFSEELRVSADLLRDFIGRLYLPGDSYRFDVIRDDLLGIIYERFLGSVVAVRDGHVTAEQKPEVRHAGGVHYTPRFVVDTIIRRVIGPRIAGRAPQEVLDVKVLDPACGSGSFLIAAFQYLTDHCVRHIQQHPEAAAVPAGPKARTKKRQIAFRDAEGNWHLSPDFRASLLTSCLYGVDIDPQAVEVTIMSLYLKMLEGKLPPHWQRDWVANRLLPALDNNVRCGNSVLSQTDFDRYWDRKNGSLFGGDEDVRFRMNPFDWTSQTRGFGRVFDARGGFDCIIGNPPYIRVQELNKWAPDECEFYKWRYKSAARGNYDIYVIFVERALELLVPDGLLGFICPHKFWQAAYGQGLRGIIAEGRHLRSVLDFGDQQVFDGATTYTAVHVLGRQPNPDGVDYVRVLSLADGDATCRRIDAVSRAKGDPFTRRKVNYPVGGGRFAFRVSVLTARKSESPKLPTLGELAHLAQGFKTGADKVYTLKVVGRERRLTRCLSLADHGMYLIETKLLRPLIKSGQMRRYEIAPSELVLVYPYSVTKRDWRLLSPDELADRFPRAWEYLSRMRPMLAKREQGRWDGPTFYHYSRQQNFVALSKPKIVTPDIADHCRFAYDRTGRYVFSGGGAGGNAVLPKPRIGVPYLLGLLNSRVVESWLRANGTPFRGGYLNCEIRFIRDIPIVLPRTAGEKRDAGRIIERVEALMDLTVKSRRAGPSDHDSERHARQIESLEAQIDEIVCRLYGVDEVPEQ